MRLVKKTFLITLILLFHFNSIRCWVAQILLHITHKCSLYTLLKSNVLEINVVVPNLHELLMN